MDGAPWQVNLITRELWPVTDVEMSEIQVVPETSEEIAAPEITEVGAAEMEAEVLTAACELIDTEVC